MKNETKWMARMRGMSHDLRAIFDRIRGPLLVSCLLSIGVPTLGFAGSHPADHAPIGVMADHTHEKGEWMVSYRYMRMRMKGNRDDDDRIDTGEVLARFPVTPTRMDMEMHMFGLMVAPIERVTLMAMLPLVRTNMDHLTRTGTRFTTRTDGLGDFRAMALVDLVKEHGHRLHAQVGFSFPTGSITEQDRTPASGASTVRLPYPMQLGSGTYDFLPGLTYTGHGEILSWGAQARGEVRLNENHANYRLGNEYAVTAWGGLELTQWLSASVRFEWLQSLNVRGRDESPRVNPAMVPTADPGRRAAARLDALFGVNLVAPSGPLEGVRLAIEAGVPTYQDLDGPQLETDWTLTTGVQYAF